MKTALFFILAFMFGPAFATVDGHTRAFIVVQNTQTDEFFVERVPVIGCYGLERGPQLVQFTSEYKATSNIGCGAAPTYENINYLTCAKVLESKETDDFMSFSEITLDISKCDAKNDEKFISAVGLAARLNFPIKNGRVKLKLVK